MQMQTMDCHGGHFSRVKPTYRRQVRRRTFQLLIEYCNATELQRAAGVGQGGKLLIIKEGFRAHDKSRVAGHLQA